jgi:hypothetical protein
MASIFEALQISELREIIFLYCINIDIIKCKLLFGYQLSIEELNYIYSRSMIGINYLKSINRGEESPKHCKECIVCTNKIVGWEILKCWHCENFVCAVCHIGCPAGTGCNTKICHNCVFDGKLDYCDVCKRKYCNRGFCYNRYCDKHCVKK